MEDEGEGRRKRPEGGDGEEGDEEEEEGGGCEHCSGGLEEEGGGNRGGISVGMEFGEVGTGCFPGEEPIGREREGGFVFACAGEAKAGKAGPWCGSGGGGGREGVCSVENCFWAAQGDGRDSEGEEAAEDGELQGEAGGGLRGDAAEDGGEPEAGRGSDGVYGDLDVAFVFLFLGQFHFFLRDEQDRNLQRTYPEYSPTPAHPTLPIPAPETPSQPYTAHTHPQNQHWCSTPSR